MTLGVGHSFQHRSQYDLPSMLPAPTETRGHALELKSSSLLIPSDTSDTSDTWSALPEAPKLRLRDGVSLSREDTLVVSIPEAFLAVSWVQPVASNQPPSPSHVAGLS